MSDTPETDHLEVQLGQAATHSHPILWEHSRKMERERDDALSQIAQAEKRAERYCQERDEAREDLEHWKIEYEIVVSRLCGTKHERDNGIIAEHEIIPVLMKERDEARNDIIGWENKWKFAVDMAARAELERDDALNKIKELNDILR